MTMIHVNSLQFAKSSYISSRVTWQNLIIGMETNTGQYKCNIDFQFDFNAIFLSNCCS